MARPRNQHGQLIDGGDHWFARWREDCIDQRTGAAKRIRKKKVLASKKECPTRQMAQSKLDELLHGINTERLVLPSDLRSLEVVLCDSCRERLLAALQAQAVASSDSGRAA